MSIISLCDLVREWTLVAHWESAISPSKTLSSAACVRGPSAARENSARVRNENGLTFITTHLVFAKFGELGMRLSFYGSTKNFMFICSWSWLQITVQMTTYSPASLGAVSANS